MILILFIHWQYVKVANGQRGVMELGGNLPDTLIEHLMLPVFEGAVEEKKHAPINELQLHAESDPIDPDATDEENDNGDEETRKAEVR